MEYIKCDPFASDLVRGKSEAEIRARFPFAVDCSSLPDGDYRRYWQNKAEKQHPHHNVKLYWLQEGGAVAVLVLDGRGKSIGYYKP